MMKHTLVCNKLLLPLKLSRILQSSKFRVVGIILVHLALSIFLFREYLSGSRAFLYTDVAQDIYLNQYPNLYWASENLTISNLLSWQNAFGLGTPFLFGSLLRLSVVDPFILIAILSDSNYLIYTIGLIAWMKVVIAGLLFYLYIAKKGFSRYTSLIISILYGYSGQMLVRLGWFHYGTEMVFLPLLLLCLDYFVITQRKHLIILPFLWLALYHPFHFFVYLLFSLIYLGFSCFFKRISQINLIVVIRNFSLSLIIAAVIGSFVFLPNLRFLLESPRITSASLLVAKKIWKFTDRKTNVTTILRFFSNDIMRKGDFYSGSENYLEDSINYIGLLPLLIFTQFSILKRSRRQIILSSVIVFLIIAYFSFNGLRFIMNIFSYPYYKTTTIFVLFPILILTAYLFEKTVLTGKIRRSVLTINALFLILILYFYGYIQKVYSVNLSIINPVIVLLLVYYFLFLLRSYRILQSGLFNLMLISVVCLEAVYLGDVTINQRKTISGTKSLVSTYFDGTHELLNRINSYDKTYYRVEKNFQSASFNDNLIQGYNGTSAYQSFNHPNTVRFFKRLGMIDDSFSFRTYQISSNNRILSNLVGTRYLISKDNISNTGYSRVLSDSDKQVYKNIYATPNGFMYSDYILESELSGLGTDDLTKVITKIAATSASVSCARLADMKSVTDAIKTFNYETNARNLVESSFAYGMVNDNLIRVTIAHTNGGLAFLPFPFDIGWDMYVDDRKADPVLVNFGFLGVCIPPNSRVIEARYNYLNYFTL